jgi:hypothetical protein
MFNKLKATTLAAFFATALSSTPAFALDVTQFLTPGITDFGIFKKNRNSQAPARGLSVGFGVSPICHRTHEVFVLV